MKLKSQSLRRFDISKLKVVKLKKTTFWNVRPYQFSTPLVDGDMLYVGVDAGYFYGIDLNRRQKLWTYITEEGAVQGQAATSGFAVFFGDCKANFYALEAKTGKELWKSKLDTSIMSAPLVSEGKVYVLTMSGRLYALDVTTGVEVWHTSSADAQFGFTIRRASSPVMVGGVIYFGTSSGYLVAVDGSDGDVLWAKQIGDRGAQFLDVDSKPLIIGDKLYVNSADGRLTCVETATGKVVWDVLAGASSDPVLKDGKIYVTGQGKVYSIEPESGNILWEQDLEEIGLSSPALGKDFMVVATTTDKMYVIDSANGDVILDRYIRKGSFGEPLVLGDHVIVLSNSGRLFTYKLKELPPRKSRITKK